jgi:hypothetical protein
MTMNPPQLRALLRVAPTFRAKLNRAVFSGAGRVTFRSWELSERARLAAQAVRCDVYAERHGFTGRARFGGEL